MNRPKAAEPKQGSEAPAALEGLETPAALEEAPAAYRGRPPVP